MKNVTKLNVFAAILFLGGMTSIIGGFCMPFGLSQVFITAGIVATSISFLCAHSALRAIKKNLDQG